MAEGEDGVEFLVVHSDAKFSISLGDDHNGAAVVRGGVLDEPGGEVFVEDGIYLFRDDWVHAVWFGAHRGAVGRNV